jgi:hypothetical protein
MNCGSGFGFFALDSGVPGALAGRRRGVLLCASVGCSDTGGWPGRR